MSFDDTYAESAHRLVLQSKLSMDLRQLLTYNGPLVRLAIEEQCQIDRRMSSMEADGVTTPEHPRWPALIILARVIQQNKRCLLAYHNQRLELIQAAYWAAAGSVPHVLTNLRRYMSKEEVTFLRGYHDSVVEYRRQFAVDDIIDLALGIENPPRVSIFVMVEGVVSLDGPVCTESGVVEFLPGKRYVVRKYEIEHLILQGYLREV
ncbi:hypothetical protein R3P38DRAFT_2495839 [Favolaschia claudopus]|uniref:DNA replication complex GINS protein PSF1 n=1 Tax=Favolaschia claudopus TaxID=2862362 RepID=A0AAW0E7M0_9AGAR